MVVDHATGACLDREVPADVEQRAALLPAGADAGDGFADRGELRGPRAVVGARAAAQMLPGMLTALSAALGTALLNLVLGTLAGYSLIVVEGDQGQALGEYLSGFLIEKSLSIDNVFVWAVIFSFFAVPREYQFRVLFWGIFGALVLRAIFIVAGVELIERFDWILYVFGLFLIATAVKKMDAIMASYRFTDDRIKAAAGKFVEEKNTPESTHIGIITRVISPDTPSIVRERDAISKPRPPNASAPTSTTSDTVTIDARSGTPNTNKVGKVTRKQLEEIAKVKARDLNAADLEAEPGSGDIPVHLGLHFQDRRHRSRPGQRASAYVQYLFWRTFHGTPSDGLRGYSETQDHKARRQLLASQYGLDRRSVRRG